MGSFLYCATLANCHLSFENMAHFGNHHGWRPSKVLQCFNLVDMALFCASYVVGKYDDLSVFAIFMMIFRVKSALTNGSLQSIWIVMERTLVIHLMTDFV